MNQATENTVADVEELTRVGMLRKEGQVDLVEQVRLALEEAGLGDRVKFFLEDPNVAFAKDKNPNVQRFKLNTWLDTQYLSTQRQVSLERSMILDHAAPDMWMIGFKTYHVNFLKTLGLPQNYDHFVESEAAPAENG